MAMHAYLILESGFYVNLPALSAATQRSAVKDHTWLRLCFFFMATGDLKHFSSKENNSRLRRLECCIVSKILKTVELNCRKVRKNEEEKLGYMG